MGLFSGVRDNWRKAEAAAIIQGLLEHQEKVGMFDLHPGRVANKLVSVVWEQTPDVFDGRRGVAPHKVSVAAAALVNAVHNLSQTKSDDPNTCALAICLGQILQDVEQNKHMYALNKLDEQILSSSVLTFAEVAEAMGMES